jgi:hypothetical protein
MQFEIAQEEETRFKDPFFYSDFDVVGGRWSLIVDR